jgi:hypothetical protein
MFIVSLNAKLNAAGDIHISCNNFMAVVEMMGGRFLHHVLRFIFSDIAEECTASICHHPPPEVRLFSRLSLVEDLKRSISKVLKYLAIPFPFPVAVIAKFPQTFPHNQQIFFHHFTEAFTWTCSVTLYLEAVCSCKNVRKYKVYCVV